MLLVPLFRIAPAIYQWQMRSRVYRHYLDLFAIDAEVGRAKRPDAAFRPRVPARRIEAGALRLNLPVSFREYAYALRGHIDIVRRRIAARCRAIEG